MARMLCKLFISLVFLLVFSAPLAAEEMNCEAPVEVHDADGNLILTFRQTYIGHTPYEEFTAWDWEAEYTNNFYKQTIINHTDQPIEFVKVFKRCFDAYDEYCIDDNGESYRCNSSSDLLVAFDDDNVALWDLQSNTLPPGEIITQQDATGFENMDDFQESHGKIDYETWTIEHSGHEYSFTTCKRYP